MNPLTNVKNIQKYNQTELDRGVPIEKSWHQQYKDSAWIFIGGLSYGLTEGDIITVFSQYGEIVNINLIRDHKTGKTKGYGFLCYEDQRSTILAVDNLNGIKLVGRIVRVDHVEEYKVPKMKEDLDNNKKKLFIEGCAPQPVLVHQPEEQAPSPRLLPVKEENIKTESSSSKKKKKEKKSKKKRKHRSSSSSDSDDSPSDESKSHKKKKKKHH